MDGIALGDCELTRLLSRMVRILCGAHSVGTHQLVTEKESGFIANGLIQTGAWGINKALTFSCK